MGINQRVSLRKFVGEIRRWVEEGKSDEWIASALGTSSSSVQSFRSRNGIYRRGADFPLYEPIDYSSYEGVVEEKGPGIWFDPAVGEDDRWGKGWDKTDGVELHVTPERIYIMKPKV